MSYIIENRKFILNINYDMNGNVISNEKTEINDEK